MHDEVHRPTASPELLESLSRLFTHFEKSAARTLLGAEAYATPADDAVLSMLRTTGAEDHDLALRVAELMDRFDAVPHAGAFPYWRQDLNYLTVVWCGGFVLRALDEDLRLLDEILAEWPEIADAIEPMRAERRVRRERLAPVVVEAQEREAKETRDAIERAGQAREARAQAAKAAKEGDRPSKAAPGEQLSPKERARRAILERRAAEQAETAAAAPPTAPEDGLPDPDEAGISPKEKARRQILRMRARRPKPQ